MAGDCCPEFPRIRVRNGDGSYTDLAVVDNVITLPGAVGETPWVGQAGCGLEIIDGGDAGHEPTFNLLLDDESPIPILCDENGVRVGPVPSSPKWQSPNETKQGGIRVFPGGDLGHEPTFALALAAGAPFGVNAQGCLEWTGGAFGAPFTCADLAGCSINAFGNVDISGGDIVTVSETGSVSSGNLCELVEACLAAYGPGLISIEADGTISAVEPELSPAEFLTGNPDVAAPTPPTGTGPWALQYDGVDLTWVPAV